VLCATCLRIGRAYAGGQTKFSSVKACALNIRGLCNPHNPTLWCSGNEWNAPFAQEARTAAGIVFVHISATRVHRSATGCGFQYAQETKALLDGAKFAACIAKLILYTGSNRVCSAYNAHGDFDQ
jgi:hypothetical protein